MTDSTGATGGNPAVAAPSSAANPAAAPAFSSGAAANRPLTESELTDRLVPVLLGGDIMIYTWMRCFWKRYDVRSIVLAGADAKAIRTSRYCDYRIVEGVDRDEICVETLMKLGAELKSQGKLPLVLGTGDWYARTLSAYKPELSEYFIVPYIDFPLLDRVTQKEYFYQLCTELGIDHPRTWSFDCADASVTLPLREFTYPLIAKPSNSARYHFADIPDQQKLYRIEEPGELETLFTQLQASPYDRELIVQEYIPGADDQEWSITCFSDADGNVKVWSTGRVLLQDHAPTAWGNPVCILVQKNERIAAEAARLLKALRYEGFSNLDVKYDARDDSYRFLEINTRAGRNTYYMQLGGADIAELIVREYVTHEPIDELCACNEWLYLAVPPYVVKRTVVDAEAREQALRLIREHRSANPSFNGEDTLAHNFWARLQDVNQIRKFNRYVWSA